MTTPTKVPLEASWGPTRRSARRLAHRSITRRGQRSTVHAPSPPFPIWSSPSSHRDGMARGDRCSPTALWPSFALLSTPRSGLPMGCGTTSRLDTHLGSTLPISTRPCSRASPAHAVGHVAVDGGPDGVRVCDFGALRLPLATTGCAGLSCAVRLALDAANDERAFAPSPVGEAERQEHNRAQ